MSVVGPTETSTFHGRVAVCDNLWDLYPSLGPPQEEETRRQALRKKPIVDELNAYLAEDEIYAQVTDRLLADDVDVLDGIETIPYDNQKELIGEILGQIALYMADRVPRHEVVTCAQRLAIWELPHAGGGQTVLTQEQQQAVLF